MRTNKVALFFFAFIFATQNMFGSTFTAGTFSSRSFSGNSFSGTTALVSYWADGTSVGNLDNSANWQEISGMATPRLASNSNNLWIESDSPANMIASVNKTTAANTGVLTLTGATAMVDLEDIESCSTGGVNYLYGMDYGNNGNGANSRGAGVDMRIFRIVEPTITGSNISTSSFIEIDVAYPVVNGPTLRDAEASIVDPSTCDIYIIPKRNATQQVYKLPFAVSYSGTQTLEYQGLMSFAVPAVTTVALTTTPCYLVDAAVSPTGTEIFIKNYDKVYLFTRDPATQTIYQAIDTETPTEVIGYVGGGSVSPKKSHPNAEPQGEALAFDYDGSDYYSASEYLSTEGASASTYPLFKYTRLTKEPVTYIFQDGVSPTGAYAGTLDTTIWDTNPTTVYGTDATFTVDTAIGVESDQRKGLLKLDLSSIPTTATVVGARLDFYISVEGQGFKFHKMLIDWNESSTYTLLGGPIDNDGIKAAVAEDCRNGVNLNTVTGSVRNNMRLGTVQDWGTNPSNNYGWMIEQITSATGDGVQIDSRQGATAAQRPKLTVRAVL